MDEPTRDYLILLNNQSMLPLKLTPAVADEIAVDWRMGIERGAYAAFDGNDQPFTLCIRFDLISAITAERFTTASGARIPIAALLRSSQD
jgi:hypothetical protein